MRLDGNVLKGNHSFKFPKHMVKIEGTGVFKALYTITNEYEEMLHQFLVPSKSLIYLKWMLQKMQEAYVLCGHEMLIAFFTDNVKSDTAFLESISQSLTRNIHIQLEKSHYEDTAHLKLPNDIDMKYITRDLDKIDEEMKKLTNQLTSAKASEVNLIIGFDLEWNITFDEGIDSMQIAYDKTAYVLMWIVVGVLCLTTWLVFSAIVK